MNATMIIPPPPNTLAVRFGQMESMLRSCLIDRDDEVRTLIRCAVAHENLLFVGPPGTAKSLLLTSLAGAISDITDDTYFEILFGKDTAREELFGPIRVTGLKNDSYVRKLERYLATAHIAFLDEIWKASTAILNTCLTILNERKFDNDGQRVNCPLRIAVAASNEWPQAEELGAMFDRFLVRRVVRPVPRSRLNDLLFAKLPTPVPMITLADLDRANAEAMQLPFSQKAIDCYGEIIDELTETGIVVGDRRRRKSVRIAQAEAWLCNSPTVEPEHLEPLADVLWVEPMEQPMKALEIVTRIANPQAAEINRLFIQVDEIMADVKKGGNRESAKGKLQVIQDRAGDIGTERAMKLAKYTRQLWSDLCAADLGINMKQRMARANA